MCPTTKIAILALVAMTLQPVMAEEDQHNLALQPNADLAAFATHDTIKLDVNDWCKKVDNSFKGVVVMTEVYNNCKQQFTYFKSLWMGINNQMTYVHVASQNRDNEIKQSNVLLQTRMTNFSNILSENIGKIADQNLILNNQTSSKFNVVENRISQMKDELDKFKKEFDNVKADLQKCKTAPTAVDQNPTSNVLSDIGWFIYNTLQFIFVLCGIVTFCFYCRQHTPTPTAVPAPAASPAPAAPHTSAVVPAPAAAPDSVEVLSDTTKPVKKARSASGRILTLAKACQHTGFSRLAATVTCAFSPAGSVPITDTDPTSGSLPVPDTKPGLKSAHEDSATSKSFDPDPDAEEVCSSVWRAQGVFQEAEQSELGQTYEDAEAFWAANYQYEGQIVQGYPNIDPSTNLADHVPVFINFTCSNPSDSILSAQTEMTNKNQFIGECIRLGYLEDQVLRVSKPNPTEQ